MFRTTPTFTATSAAMVAATALLLSSGAALAAGEPVIGLINKTETNPVCMCLRLPTASTWPGWAGVPPCSTARRSAWATRWRS